MSHALNRVTLIGRVGSDPQIVFPQPDLMVCTVWLVTEEHWKDQTGAVHESAEWHRIVAWQRLAEDLNQYFVRGDVVYCEGHLTTRAWHDAEQLTYFVTELVADRLMILHRDRQSPEQRDSIYIPDNTERVNEPYQPPLRPDAITQRKHFYGFQEL